MNKYEQALEDVLCGETIYEDEVMNLAKMVEESSEKIKLLEEACKKAQAFDIIIKHSVIKIDDKFVTTLFIENLGSNWFGAEITQEEYELLKEVLNS